jgi:endonuclease/exonuclease/phosphatase family metal-dependent hydrolase
MIGLLCRHLPLTTLIIFLIFHFSIVLSQSLTLVELNCENLFDCRDDSLKEDEEFLPDGAHHWTHTRYWRKLNNIGQELLSCSSGLPDLVALVEVENDTVLHDLTRRSLLRNAGYHYLMTESPDVRGLDVALLYQPAAFRPLCYETITVPPLKGMRPTRDILYVQGVTRQSDTLHIFVVHAPSRLGGERQTRAFRKHVMQTLVNDCLQADADAADQYKNISLREGNVVVVGDFNDYADSPSLKLLYHYGLVNATRQAKGSHGKRGTYRYQGEWRSIDHVLVSPTLYEKIDTAYINDANFLLEDEPRYGGQRPRRTFQGYHYQQGFSDHLPLVVVFR